MNSVVIQFPRLRIHPPTLCRFHRNIGDNALANKARKAVVKANSEDKQAKRRPQIHNTLPTEDGIRKNFDDAFTERPEKELVSTVVGDLPMSPATNPEFYRRRNKRKMASTSEPTVVNTELSEMVEANPYAYMLGTPIRNCRATGLTLPSAFFERFKLVVNPNTMGKWWVPDDVMLEERLGNRQKARGEDLHASQGPSTYILSSLSVLRAIFTYGGVPDKKNSKSKFSKFGKVGRARFAGPHSEDQQAARNAVFREDMPELILRLRRDFVVHQLMYFLTLKRTHQMHPKTSKKKKNTTSQSEDVINAGASSSTSEDEKSQGKTQEEGQKSGSGQQIAQASKDAAQTESQANASRPIQASFLKKSRGYIVPIASLEDAATVKAPGCVLICDPEVPADIDYSCARLEIKDSVAPSQLAVHHLGFVLGPEHTQQLIDRCPFFKQGNMYVLARLRTRDVQAELWKLQGMLRKFEPAEDW